MKTTYSPRLVSFVFGKLGAFVMATLGLGLVGFVALMVHELRAERAKALNLIQSPATVQEGMARIQKILSIDPLDHVLIRTLTDTIQAKVTSESLPIEERILLLHHYQVQFPNLKRLDHINVEMLNEYMRKSSQPSDKLKEHMLLTLDRMNPQRNPGQVQTPHKDLIAFIRKNYRDRNSK